MCRVARIGGLRGINWLGGRLRFSIGTNFVEKVSDTTKACPPPAEAVNPTVGVAETLPSEADDASSAPASIASILFGNWAQRA